MSGSYAFTIPKKEPKWLPELCIFIEQKGTVRGLNSKSLNTGIEKSWDEFSAKGKSRGTRGSGSSKKRKTAQKSDQELNEAGSTIPDEFVNGVKSIEHDVARLVSKGRLEEKDGSKILKKIQGLLAHISPAEQEEQLEEEEETEQNEQDE